MPAINIDELAAAIFAALNGSVEKGIKTGSAFIAQQSRALAVQAAMIAEGRIRKQIVDEDFQFLMEQLKTLTENFARSVAALTVITLQNAWNAIAGALWGAIDTALGGVGLKVPKASKA